MLLKLQASIDGTPILESAVEGADAGSILAAADDMIARSGVTRDDARAWAMDALETRRYADDARATERLLSTLLWLACRGHPGAGQIAQAVHLGGVLACWFRRDEGKPGTLAGLRFAMLAPTEEKDSRAPGSTAVH
jgi:hypothetical protein